MNNKIFFGIFFFLVTSIFSTSYADDFPFPNWFPPEKAKIKLIDSFVASTNKVEDFGFYKIKEIQVNPVKYDWGLHCYEGIIIFDTTACNGIRYDIMWCAGSLCDNNVCTPLWKTMSRCPTPTDII